MRHSFLVNVMVHVNLLLTNMQQHLVTFCSLCAPARQAESLLDQPPCVMLCGCEHSCTLPFVGLKSFSKTLCIDWYMIPTQMYALKLQSRCWQSVRSLDPAWMLLSSQSMHSHNLYVPAHRIKISKANHMSQELTSHKIVCHAYLVPLWSGTLYGIVFQHRITMSAGCCFR